MFPRIQYWPLIGCCLLMQPSDWPVLMISLQQLSRSMQYFCNGLYFFQACKNFYDDGVCKQECPPMHIYNPVSYRWERDPKGKYAYGATCVKECPEHLLKDNGACVRSCPEKFRVSFSIFLSFIIVCDEARASEEGHWSCA